MISTTSRLEGDVPDYEAILSRFVATTAPQKIRSRMKEKLRERKTGRLYSEQGGEGFTRAHRASAEGEAPAGRTGALERSLKIVHPGTLESEIVSALGYPAILEDEMNRPLWGASRDEMIPILENDLLQAMTQYGGTVHK